MEQGENRTMVFLVLPIGSSVPRLNRTVFVVITSDRFYWK